jgi:hypothetical protein
MAERAERNARVEAKLAEKAVAVAPTKKARKTK